MVQDIEKIISREDFKISVDTMEMLVLKGSAKTFNYAGINKYSAIFEDRCYYKQGTHYELICPWNYKVKPSE